MPHLHCAPGIALRLFVLAGLALCGTSAEAAEADSNQATPPDDRKLSGGRTAQPEPVPLEGIVVVGSRLPAAEGQTAQDIHIYDLERIEQSGQSSVGDFLATLPEVSLAAPQNATGATPVRLRGAIFGSALILINGGAQPVTEAMGSSASSISTPFRFRSSSTSSVALGLVGDLRRRCARGRGRASCCAPTSRAPRRVGWWADRSTRR
jgi:hypothetical protein